MAKSRVYNTGDEIGKSKAIYLCEAGRSSEKQPKRLVKYQCRVVGCTNIDIGRESSLYHGYSNGTCKLHKGLHRHYDIGDTVGDNGAVYLQDIKMCNGVRYIECKCANSDCNNTFIAPESKIRNGLYKGYCEQCKYLFSGLHGRKERIVNQPISDELDAPIFLGYISKNNRLYGHFLCGHCYKESFVRALDLVEGKRKQWLCNKCSHTTSKGELHIKQILSLLDIDYIEQYSFDDLRGKNGQYLKFDFYLPKFNCCIEYDGEQHYNYRGAFGSSFQEFLDGQKRDKIKNEYCSAHNILLIRIPYTILQNELLDELYILNSLDKEG